MSGAPDSSQLPLVSDRACGECQMCCIVPSIDKPEIQKVPGAPCRHCANGGCGIYETRPQICRAYYCGWRRTRSFPDGWRPDISGIFADLEINSLPQFGPLAVNLILIGNPLKTVRRPDFMDFVARNVLGIALYLMLPGPKGATFARVSLNTPPVIEASTRARSELRLVLEGLLKRLIQYPVIPYVMENSGADVST
jgi:hypothetical protein